MTSPAFLTTSGSAQLGGGRVGLLCLHRAHLKNRGELHQLGFVLVRVMLAEEEFAA